MHRKEQCDKKQNFKLQKNQEELYVWINAFIHFKRDTHFFKLKEMYLKYVFHDEYANV